MATFKDVVIRGRGRLRYADFVIRDTGVSDNGAIYFDVRTIRIRRWHWTYWWMVLRIIMKIH